MGERGPRQSDAQQVRVTGTGAQQQTRPCTTQRRHRPLVVRRQLSRVRGGDERHPSVGGPRLDPGERRGVGSRTHVIGEYDTGADPEPTQPFRQACLVCSVQPGPGRLLRRVLARWWTPDVQHRRAECPHVLGEGGQRGRATAAGRPGDQQAPGAQ
jgi:hypothetical protein